MFEVYAKDVTINGKTYTVKPLPGKHLPKLYKLIGKMQGISGDGDKVFEVLGEESVADLHELAVEMLHRSNPAASKDDVDLFVSQNLIAILPVVLEVHFNNKV